MRQKRANPIRDETGGYKCPRCEVTAFRVRQQYYRHWDREHWDANSSSSSSSDDSVSRGGEDIRSTTSSSTASDLDSESTASSAQHSSSAPDLALPCEPRSASVDRGISQDGGNIGVEQCAMQDAMAAGQDMVSAPDGCPCSEVPGDEEGDLFFDAVCPAPLDAIASALASATCQRPAHSRMPGIELCV